MSDSLALQKRYSSMSDELLMELAQNEMPSLTDNAVQILYDEFQRRALDGSSYFKDEFKDRAKAAALEYAFGERKKGKTDEQIFAELKNFGLSEWKAKTLIERLPKTGYKNEPFEKLIAKKGDITSLATGALLIFLFGISITFFLMGLRHGFGTATIIGLVFGAVGLVAMFVSKEALKGGNYWIKILYEHPTNIVWIKPIKVKHTIGYVFTWFEIQNFELLTKDRRNIVLEINSKEEQQIFFEGVNHLFPHAHIGYSEVVDEIYKENSMNFINELQTQNLYTPFDHYKK